MSQCVWKKRLNYFSELWKIKLLRVPLSTAAASSFCPEEGQKDIEKIGMSR